MTISLQDIRLQAFHGVFPDERKSGNLFRVDVSVTLPDSAGCDTDDVKDTINYQTIYDIVVREMAIPSALLEHVASRIKNALLSEIPGCSEAHVAVAKHNPPLGGEVEWASVSL